MSAIEIMQQIQAGTLTPEQGAAELAKTEKAKRKVSIKKGEAGGVVVKLSSQVRYPTTLYANQWLELSEVMPEILAFIEANKSSLAWKEAA